MDRLTCKIFAVIAFLIFCAAVSAPVAVAADYRYFEYFEGLPGSYIEEGWQGYNYHASDLIGGNTEIILYGEPKQDAEGQPYTCIGWKDASGSITPQSGDINRVEFTLNADSSITWVYRKTHKVTFAVSGMNRSLSAWGNNIYGQLGLGESEPSQYKNTPTQAGPDLPWVAIAAGKRHTLAIDTDGNLWVWGANGRGQMGLGDAQPSDTPIQVQPGTSWMAVAAGDWHTVAIRSDGTLWTWGANDGGQLGLGDAADRTVPNQVGAGTDWKYVAAGGAHTLAIKQDGTLWGSGWNHHGQLGIGTWANVVSLTQVQPGTAWRSVAAGYQHSLGISSDGKLWTWGGNGYGQLGLGDLDERNVPSQVGVRNDWTFVAGGGHHSLAIGQDGTLWGWGSNEHGQLGSEIVTGAGWIYSAETGHEYALTGSMRWEDAEAYAVSQGAHLVTVNDVDEHVWIRDNLGMNRCWIGLYDSTGDFDWQWVSGEPVSFTYWYPGEPNYQGDERYVEMNYPPDYDYGRWNNYMGTNLLNGVMERAPRIPVPTQVTADLDRDGLPDSDWSFVAAGQDHTLAVKTDGTLWAWGNPDQGRLGWAHNDTTGHLYTLTDNMPWWAAEAAAVSLGGHLVTINDQDEQNWLVTTFGGNERFWIGLTDWDAEGDWKWASGESFDFGSSLGSSPWNSGEPNNGGGVEDFVEMNYLSPGRWNDHQGSILKRGIIERSADAWEPVQVGVDANWSAVAAGGDHTVALKRDGGLWAFGDNESGQLGLQTIDPVLSPTQVWSSCNVVSMAVGEGHTLAVKSDGSLWAWGNNDYGQLGLGDNIDRDYPTHVQPGATWSAVAAGRFHTLALKSDGTLWAWGNNNTGQLGLGDNVDRHIPTQVGQDDKWAAVYAGYYHTLAIKVSGSLWAWGYNSSGQLGLGSNSNKLTPNPVQPGTTWLAVAAGGAYTLAKKQDGTLWAWGYNEFGQLGLGHNGNKWTPTPVVVGPPATWKAVAAGYRHTVAIRSDGTLWAWGSNAFWQLGLGDSDDRNTAYQVGTDNDWIAVAAGGYHTLAIKSGGTLWGWGRNHFGQLGLGDGDNRNAPTQVGSGTDWISVAAGAEWDGNHSLAIRGPHRLELQPHMGPRFIVEGTEVAASAKVVPTNGQGTYSLTNFNSKPTTFGSSFTVESGVDFTWTFEESRAVDVNFDPDVPESVQNASGAFPAEGESRFVEGSTVTLHVEPVVTDTVTGAVYVCTGWNGAGQVPTSGNAASVTVPSLDRESSITWTYAEARSLATKFDGLPEHLRGDERFDPRGTGKGWDPQEPVWLPKDSPQTLTPPGEIYDEDGRIRYVLDPDESTPTPAAGTDDDNNGVPDTYIHDFTLTDNATVTWVYHKELRLTVGVAGLGEHEEDAGADPYGDAYYEPDVFVTISALKDAGINRYFENLLVLSGNIGSPPAPVADTANGRKETTFLFTEPTELSWSYEAAERWVIGRKVDPPPDADGDAKPDWPAEKPGAFFWDDANHTLYPVQPFASAVLEWENQTQGGSKILQTGYSVWPSDAALWAWGLNSDGQLGLASPNADFDAPEQAAPGDLWVAAAAGASHTAAIKPDGSLWAWGDNQYGQLGLNNNTDAEAPQQVTADLDDDGNPDTDWAAVAAGGNHTLAMKADGSLWTWGMNNHGQLGLGDTADRSYPTRVGAATGWVAVAAGYYHCLAVKSNGTLWSWGNNGYGQLGRADAPEEPKQVGLDTDWVAVVAGLYHSLALKSNGALYSWGRNDLGQLGLGDTTHRSSPAKVGTDDNWASLDAGLYHTLAIKTDGSLYGWGWKLDGGVYHNGTTTGTPEKIMGEQKWKAVAAGANHVLALESNGTLWAWGNNDNGQLGLGFNAPMDIPTRVGTDIYWSSIAAGSAHTIALKSMIQKHVAGTPANLQPPESANTFEAMHYSEAYGNFPGPTPGDPVFDPTGSGKSLLRYSTGENDPPLFVVAESVVWDNMLWATGQGGDHVCIIGEDITPPADVTHDDPEGRSGFVFFEKAYYDGLGDDKAYNRGTRAGQIIPVNETTVNTPNDRQMVVVWYETGAAAAGWPVRAVRYRCQWPANQEKIIIASGNGSDPLAEQEYMGKIYYQPDPEQAGYNPNEEHALLLGNKVFALRNDLNTYQQDNGTWVGPFAEDQETTSEPYILLKYWNADTESWRMKVFKVEATGNGHDFAYPIAAADPILPLMPMDVLPKPEDSYMAAGEDWYHKDHKGGHWAKAANWREDDVPEPAEADKSRIVMHWYYPLQSGFYYPFRKADGSPVGVGDPVPFLNGGSRHQDPPADVAYVVSWPGDVKTLNIGETLTEAKYGLPDVVNWAAGKVIFDENVHSGGGSLAKLIDPFTERSVPLGTLPEGLRTENVEGKLRFPDLPYSLRARLFYDPTNEKLIFRGISYDSGIGEVLLLPNIMTVREKERLQDFEPYWRNAVEMLFDETRNFIAGSQQLVGVPMALTAGAADGQGYVVLAENDDASLEAAPVALHVIRVAEGPYQGEIKVITPDDVFDEKLTLRHSGDFGGQPEKLTFAWYYKPDNSGLPPGLPQDPTDTNGWVLFGQGQGLNAITIEGAGKLTLSDNWFMVHYYYGTVLKAGDASNVGYPALAVDPSPAASSSPFEDQNNWSGWAGAPGGETAQLAPGWIKRVVADLNPLDARVKDFRNYAVSTDVSMVTQLGQRYEGDIALSGAPENLNNLGLIEAYETVMGRARDFSIDAAPPADYGPVNNAILNAGTRIADFYTLLGNEAYRDALDPTIGFDTQSGALGTMASSVFAFQNQLGSMLEEELALLRGRDDTMSTTRARPVYNRLVWNFTQGDGELAYTQAYNIRDMDGSGVVDELDAKEMYPQGHGDAWGHYLTAMKVWYQLLRHDHFTWEPRIESVLVGGAPIPVDYLDERKFARTAAAKAKVGAEIVNLTYRRSYVEDPAGQWQGYKDTDAERAWGVDGWARRAGQGALFDWAVANAMLPSQDPVTAHSGIQKIDRGTVPELASIAAELQAIQTQADRADRGLNPLGLAKGVVPFDLDPSLLTPFPGTEVKTHFEQVYDRALGALENARTVFDYATRYTLMLRQNEDTLVDFRRNIEDQEREYTNRLIQIFGYPYEGDIGPDGTYKSGYNGPDLFHFLYVGLPDLTGEPLMGQQVAYTYTFEFDDLEFQDDDEADPLLKGLNEKTTTDDEGNITPSVEITYHIDSETPWLSRHAGWGKRRAPGEIQIALSELIKAHANYKRGLTELEGQLGVIQANVDILEAKHGVRESQIQVLKDLDNDDIDDSISDLEEEIRTYNQTILAMRRIGDALEEFADWSTASVATQYECTVGVSGVPPGPVTTCSAGGSMGVGAFVALGLNAGAQVVFTIGDILEEEILSNEHKIAEKERYRDRKLFIDDARFEVQQMVKELETMESDVRAKLQELYGLREVIHQCYGRFQFALAEGERLLTEREVFRKRTAADVQDYRYQDMGFRTFRNDAVEKYRATFELAARYAYLAATAYDYETNLVGSETGSGRAFLTDIVKQRSPGVILDGKPMVGKRGLADPLARMNQNFGVHEGQLGFNNPQTETNRFSLRRELFRFKNDQASDLVWHAELENYVVGTLWNFPPFRRFCRPFADESSGDQPGLVIPFSTEVNFGYNFFGWPLGAQDSAYDPSNFATKIRAVGVWFKGYETAGLSSTPRVYLVPVGADVLRTPDGDDFATREWYVVDQKLPVPFPVSDAELSEETWIPVSDSLSDILGGIRRFSSFRAFPDSDLSGLSEAEIIASQSTSDTRLIGRSVWNTQWLLIIPGGTLLADPDAGLDAFIDNVTDIKLFFQTYAFSGN